MTLGYKSPTFLKRNLNKTTRNPEPRVIKKIAKTKSCISDINLYFVKV
jgi:hypothetical protein